MSANDSQSTMNIDFGGTNKYYSEYANTQTWNSQIRDRLYLLRGL